MKLRRRAAPREGFSEGIEGGPCGSVARVDENRQGRKDGNIDEGQDAIDIGGAGAFGGDDDATRRCDRRVVLLCQRLDRGESGRGIQRGGAATDQLHAVVVHRIVRGRHLDSAIGIKMGGGKVHLFGAAKAKVDHVGACRDQPIDDRGHQFLGRCAAVAPHDDARGPERPGESRPDAASNARVKIDAEAPANVIGLEAGKGSHGCFLWVGGLGPWNQAAVKHLVEAVLVSAWGGRQNGAVLPRRDRG